MNIPEFTAQASLYRTSNRYRSSMANVVDSLANQSVVAAYFPGPESQRKCQGCLETCLATNGLCLLGAVVFWPPAIVGCSLTNASCVGYCLTPGSPSDCCPKFCRFEPFNQPGGGCCDQDEQCVDPGDPNSRSGCCPSDQSVCGGKCCAKGDYCCGNECCPGGWHCIDGFCSEFGLFSNEPPPKPPPYNPLTDFYGLVFCNGVICGPGEKCCGAQGCQGACVN